MTTLSFPLNPIDGQQYAAPNGVQYVYDGVKWIVETTSSSSTAVTNSTQDRVAPMFVDGNNSGITFTYDATTNTMSAEVTAVSGSSLVNGLHTVTLGSNGNITTPSFTIPNAAGTSGQVLKWPGSGSTLVWSSDNNTVSSLVNGLHTVSLGSNGHTTLPGLLSVDNGVEGSITGPNGVNIYAQNATPLGLVWTLDGQENLFENDPLLNAINNSIQCGIAGVTIEVNPASGGGIFTFAPNKTLRLPPGGDIVDSNGVSVLGGGSEQYFGTLKHTHNVIATYPIVSVDTVANTFVVTGDASNDGGDAVNISEQGIAWSLSLISPFKVYDAQTNQTTVHVDNAEDTVISGWSGQSMRSVTRNLSKTDIGFDNSFTLSTDNVVGLRYLAGDVGISGNVIYNKTSYNSGVYVAPGGESTSYVYVPGNSESNSTALQIANYSTTGRVNINVNGYNWNFNANNSLENNSTHTRTVNGANIVVSPITPTVIWTALDTWTASAKLTIQIEGNEAGDVTGWHTQSCEAIIAARANTTSEPQMTVYGVIHTSVAPLVTFTVQRNATTNLIELVATPTGTADLTLYPKVYSVEMISRD